MAGRKKLLGYRNNKLSKNESVKYFFGGGDLTEILSMHEDVIRWAKDQNCTAFNMTGRFGWKKPLAKHGWKPMHSSYVKEI